MARNALSRKLWVPWAVSLWPMRTGVATPWSQPIRAQYLSGSGPMRGLHPAWRPPQPWLSRVLGGQRTERTGRWTWSCGSPCGPGWLWTSPRTRAPGAGPHTYHTSLTPGTVLPVGLVKLVVCNVLHIMNYIEENFNKLWKTNCICLVCYYTLLWIINVKHCITYYVIL